MAFVAPLRAGDRAAWEPLWAGYLEFYRTDLPPEITEGTWRRLVADDRLHGIGVRAAPDAHLAGFAHYLFHPNTWAATDVCYLEDLFVAPDARGGGCARALIEAVAADARRRGAAKLYWLTHASNARARALYDRVAENEGFIRYDYPL